MTTTPEGIVKKRIRALLAKYEHVHVDMPVQNGMGAPMLDFHCCVNGRYLAIEAKAEGKKPTPRQVITIDKLREAGATVFVIAGTDSVGELEEWLNANASRKAARRAEPAQPERCPQHDTHR